MGRALPLRSHLFGRPNASNIAAAVAAAAALGIDRDAAAEGVAALKGVPGRLESVEAGQGFSVYVDYAHTDDALANTLNTVRELRPRRLIVVFGCGGDRDRTKRPLMGAAAARLSDLAILTSDNPRSEDPLAIVAEVEKGIRQVTSDPVRYRVVPDRREAIRSAILEADDGDAVVIAGKGARDLPDPAGSDDPVRRSGGGPGNPAQPGSRRTPAVARVSLAEATRGTEGVLLRGDPEATVGSYSIDTRTLKPGDLFFALVGPNHDAHRFVPEAIRNGAAAVVISRGRAGDFPGAAVIRVQDTTRALQDLGG